MRRAVARAANVSINTPSTCPALLLNRDVSPIAVDSTQVAEAAKFLLENPNSNAWMMLEKCIPSVKGPCHSVTVVNTYLHHNKEIPDSVRTHLVKQLDTDLDSLWLSMGLIQGDALSRTLHPAHVAAICSNLNSNISSGVMLKDSADAIASLLSQLHEYSLGKLYSDSLVACLPTVAGLLRHMSPEAYFHTCVIYLSEATHANLEPLFLPCTRLYTRNARLLSLSQALQLYELFSSLSPNKFPVLFQQMMYAHMVNDADDSVWDPKNALVIAVSCARLFIDNPLIVRKLVRSVKYHENDMSLHQLTMLQFYLVKYPEQVRETAPILRRKLTQELNRFEECNYDNTCHFDSTAYAVMFLSLHEQTSYDEVQAIAYRIIESNLETIRADALVSLLFTLSELGGTDHPIFKATLPGVIAALPELKSLQLLMCMKMLRNISTGYSEALLGFGEKYFEAVDNLGFLDMMWALIVLGRHDKLDEHLEFMLHGYFYSFHYVETNAIMPSLLHVWNSRMQGQSLTKHHLTVGAQLYVEGSNLKDLAPDADAEEADER